MQNAVLVLQLLVWVTWAASVVAIIKVDQRRRAAAAQARKDEVDVTIFEDKSVTPYLVLSFLCGALVLPVYFYSTRKTAKGALLGVGWTVATTVAITAVFTALAGPAQAMALRGQVTSDTSSCLADDGISACWQCLRAADAWYTGANTSKDVPKAIELYARGCARGDVSACAKLIGLPPGTVPAATITTARADAAKACATTYESQCYALGVPKKK